jgi:hypothetical protein
LLDGAVVVRSHDPELQLQGLRAALSLALGDRRARVYLVGPALALLDAAPETESGRCFDALRQAGIPLVAGDGADSADPRLTVVSERELLVAIASAPFQQTF